jgi:Na+/H+ antiporter NhaD/arsenite permease-like protein
VSVVACVVFALTYLLIATRRLALLPIGRPAGALLGAVSMVVLGVLSPGAALAAVDAPTIVLLFGTMALAVYLERSGLFARLLALTLRVSRGPRGLLLAVAVVPGIASAFLLNDAVCLFLTLPLARVCEERRLPYAPYLIALATSANLGSSATLVGNPQNMIIGSLGGLDFVPFALDVAPAAGVGLTINAALLFLYYGRRLPDRFAELSPVASMDGPWKRSLLVTVAVVVGLILGFDLGFTFLTGVMVLVLAERRSPEEVLSRVDWSLLVFFACLFVVVAGLESTGLVDRAWAWARPSMSLEEPLGVTGISVFLTLGSNLVSNVPMVLLVGPHLAALGHPERAWALVAFVTTVAGNLTLVGSVANLIVAERAREHHELGFFEYLRFGLVSTALVLAAGVPLILLTTR